MQAEAPDATMQQPFLLKAADMREQMKCGVDSAVEHYRIPGLSKPKALSSLMKGQQQPVLELLLGVILK